MNAPELSPLRRGAFWVVGCRMIGIVATMAGNILAARLLGPTDFGLFLIATTVMAVGSLLAMGGLNEAGLRFVAERLGRSEPAAARSFAFLSLRIALLGTLLTAIVLAGCAVLWHFFVAPLPISAMLLIGIIAGVALLAWQQLAAELTRGFGALPTASVFSGGQTGGPLSNMLFAVGLALCWLAGLQLSASAGIVLLVACVALTCPLALAGLWRTMQTVIAERSPTAIPLDQQRALVATGLLLLTNQVLALISQQSDLWIAGAILPTEDVGLFGAAKRVLLLVAMPVQMATLTIVGSMPRLYAQGRVSELESVLRTAATAAAVPALLALALMTLFPSELLRTVFGNAYSGGASVLLALLGGYILLVLSGNPQHVLIMTGRHHVVLLVNLVAAVVLVFAGIAGSKMWGATGLAAASSASLALQNGILWWMAHRELNVWTHVGWPTRLLADDGRNEMTPEPASTTV